MIQGNPVDPVDLWFGEQLEVRYKPVSRFNILKAVHDLNRVSWRFFLQWKKKYKNQKLKLKIVAYIPELVTGDTNNINLTVEGLDKCIVVQVLAGEPSVGRHVHQQNSLQNKQYSLNLFLKIKQLPFPGIQPMIRSGFHLTRAGWKHTGYSHHSCRL